MPGRPLRFIHASDFHLERPLGGVAEVPDQLRDVFIDAAYMAARRVFDTVLAEEADFLVLSGGILTAEQSGPRGPLFLGEQFARLAARGMLVYWAGSEIDPPEAWPGGFPSPGNVRLFPRGRAAEYVHERDGAALARVVGVSRDGQRPLRPGDFAPDPGGLFTIAVAHGTLEASALEGRGIHYWALGGQHDRSTVGQIANLPGEFVNVASAGPPQRAASRTDWQSVPPGHVGNLPHAAHYPGTTQGRRPEEAGAHGCTLVEVDPQGMVRLIPTATDTARWLSERLAIDETTQRENLENLLRERIHMLVETSPKMDLLISWTIAGSGPLMGQLRRGETSAELLGWLRSEFGSTRPAAWSVSLEAEPVAALEPQWYEQETIRGDFLRAIRQLDMNPDGPLGLDAYLAEAHLAGTLAQAAGSLDQAARQRVLREAALLGVELLSGGNS